MDRLICRACGKSYILDEPRWRCDCGSVLDIQFRANLDPKRLENRSPNMWRYREALPIEDDANIVSFNEGFTPLVEVEIGDRKLLAKLEQLFPTGSFKDRGASLLISKAKELGIPRVVEDSSGNAGCAIAAYAARAGIACEIYVPERTSPAKLAQIRIYGARLHLVPGSRADTARAALEAAKDAYYASHYWNPFFFQGTKTFAYEIWEQLGFRAPEALVMPVGHGTLLIGAYLGFRDLLEARLIGKLPQLVAVQVEACAPLYRMWKENLSEPPETKPGETLAEGIAIARPLRWRQMLEALRETQGEALAVSEEEIERALVEVGGQGLYIEPTSAAAIAGFKKYQGFPGETVVAPLTGHGLKSTEKLQHLAEKLGLGQAKSIAISASV